MWNCAESPISTQHILGHFTWAASVTFTQITRATPIAAITGGMPPIPSANTATSNPVSGSPTSTGAAAISKEGKEGAEEIEKKQRVNTNTIIGVSTGSFFAALAILSGLFYVMHRSRGCRDDKSVCEAMGGDTVHPVELRTHNSHRTRSEDENEVGEHMALGERVRSPTIDMGGSPASTYPTPASAGPRGFGGFCHELSTVRNHRCE